jgi:hypothetical protein
MKEDEDYQLERTAVAERRHMPNSCDFKGGRTYSVDPVPIMRRKDHRKRQVSVHPWSKLVHTATVAIKQSTEQGKKVDLFLPCE